MFFGTQCISQKRYKVATNNENTNRNLHTPYSTVKVRMAMSDLAEFPSIRRVALPMRDR